jgi:membrane protein YfhO
MILVLRLIAVYAATTALCLFLVSHFIRPLRLRTAFLLAAAPLLLTGKAFVTAGVYAPLDITYEAPPLSALRANLGVGPPRTPVLVDVVASYIPWRKAVREALENGRLPLWNRFSLAGEPLLAVQEPAVFHPFTAVGLLLPLPQSWTLEMALRLFLALLCAYLFFSDLGCGELPAMLGAFGWAFSAFLVFYLGYPLSPGTAPLPLLLLALRRIAREPGPRALVLTVVALLLVVAAGHPETLLHVVAGAGVYFLYELARAGRGRGWPAFRVALAAGAFAIGLSAILLLPFFEILPHTREHGLRAEVYSEADRSAQIATSARHLLQNAIPWSFGVSGRGEVLPGFELPASYAGALIFPLALVGLGSRRKAKWIFLAFSVAGLLLHARFLFVADALASLPLFDLAINERLAFLAVFGNVALAVLGLERLAAGEGRRAFLLGTIAAALVFALFFFVRAARLDDLRMPRGEQLARSGLQVVPLLLAATAVGLLARRGRHRRAAAAVLFLFAGAAVLEARGVYGTFPARAFYPDLPVLETIPRSAPWRTAPIGYVFPPNMSTLYELEDVRGYVSLTLASLAETFPIWCVSMPVEWNRVADPTTPFLAFLNARYVVAPLPYRTPAGWTVLDEGREGRLIENPGALPRAFAPRSVRHENDPVRRLDLLRRVPDFAAEGIVDGTRGSNVPVTNGPAEVRITRYVGGELGLEIDARGEAIVGTSIPRWPGWKLALDGKEAPLVGYNHAFLAFRVPAGRHTARLEYRPDGFTYGAAISAGTLAIALVLLAWRPGLLAWRRGRGIS